MAKLFKPLYQCDGCGETFENPDDVRIFESLVKNGEETKQYIKTGMFCLSCIPLALDFENKVPETVVFIDPKNITNKEETGESLNNKLVEIETDQKLIIDTIRKHSKLLNKLLNQEIIHEPTIIEEIIDKEEPTPTIIEDHTPIITEEEISPLEIEKDVFSLLNIEKNGKYLVLHVINDEDSEKEFGQKYGYDNIDPLRSACGRSSLIGLYYSDNEYVNSTDIEDSPGYIGSINIINKIIYGIPNIILREAQIYPDLRISIIEKELFKDIITPVTYTEKQVENPISPKKILDDTHLKSVIDDIIPPPVEEPEKTIGFREIPHKKKTPFSRSSIDDGYI